jgi:demethylspheroidene O-methyltransferase
LISRYAFNLRNRLLASPRFQRLANAFWPTRLVARRRARDLFDVIAGFTYSQILAACVELDLFNALRDGPRSSSWAAARFGLTEDAARSLLDAAAALRLTQAVGDDQYGLGTLGAVMVGNDALREMVLHHAHFYRDMADPIGVLTGQAANTALSHYWPYAAGESGGEMSADEAQRYSTLMAASQPMIAEQVIDGYRLARHRRLLDIGGGSGAFVSAVAGRVPGLELMLFDLPPVADIARAALRDSGLGDRVAVHGGDFIADPLPQGADLITLVRIVHDHDDDVVLQLLRRIHAALPAGGTLLIAEPFAGTRGAETFGAAYFTFYLRAMGSGRPRRVDEIGALLQQTGFVATRQHRTRLPMLCGLVSSRKGPL